MRTVLLTGVLTAAAIQAGGYEVLHLRVSPELPAEPARVTVYVAVEPDPENRAIEISADSGQFYRSSRVQLDGANASRTSVVSYRDLPAGEYEIRGVLIGRDGRERAMERRRLRVVH
jgi:hypothetical protein